MSVMSVMMGEECVSVMGDGFLLQQYDTSTQTVLVYTVGKEREREGDVVSRDLE